MAISWALVVLAPAAASAARHYEKVSPADKGGADIVGDGETTVASSLGDAVAFNSRTPFGDTIGSGVSGQTQFVASRTDDGWVTHAITPTPRPDAAQVLSAPTRLQIYSHDLRSAVVWAYDLPAVTGDTPLRINQYVEDTATRALEPVTVSQVNPPTFLDFVTTTGVWGVSADVRHTSFITRTTFLPGAAPGVFNVYQWDDGVLSLAGVLPDGSVPPGGSNLLPADYRGVMSVDGTRLLFVSPASPASRRQLYLRIGGTRTARVSESELDPSDPSYNPDPTGVALQGMTPDGHNVFFTTDTPLVREDTNGGPDLYRWTESANPSVDSNLTMISQDGIVGNGSAFVGMSDDGERVYYVDSGPSLWVWDHGTTRLVSAPVLSETSLEDSLALTASAPGLGRVTPDGRYVAFLLTALSDQDPLGNTTNGHLEVYLYSLDDDTLRCVSCPSGTATSDATVKQGATNGSPQIENIGYRPRFLSDDGRVVFTTAEALTPQDKNGVEDVYEYDPTTEQVSLLSSGRGSDGAWFADASPSGDDVFVLTRQRLVASDKDDLVDVYDIRDGSALAPEPEEAQTPACEGETCQPPPTASPAEALLGSVTFDDGGSTVVPGHKTLSVRTRVSLQGAVGSLRVQLFAPGRLQWKGKGLLSGSVKRSKAGSYRLRLRLGRQARARLKAVGTYRTAVRLTFVSTDGDEVHRTTRITFRAAAKKGR